MEECYEGRMLALEQNDTWDLVLPLGRKQLDISGYTYQNEF